MVFAGSELFERVRGPRITIPRAEATGRSVIRAPNQARPPRRNGELPKSIIQIGLGDGLWFEPSVIHMSDQLTVFDRINAVCFGSGPTHPLGQEGGIYFVTPIFRHYGLDKVADNRVSKYFDYLKDSWIELAAA